MITAGLFFMWILMILKCEASDNEFVSNAGSILVGFAFITGIVFLNYGATP